MSGDGLQTEEEVDRLIITMALLMFRRLLLKSKYPKPIIALLRERAMRLVDKYSDFEMSPHEPNRHSKSKGG